MDYYVKSVIPVIESNYENFTALEKNIADFFMKNEEKMDFSAKEIAKHLFVSEASLSRFAKKCGFRGYREFIYQYEESFEEFETPTRYVNDEPTDFITVNEGDEGIRKQMEFVETQMQIEKVMQEVRDIIDYQKREHEPFGGDSFIDNREKKLQLITRK
jgi:DNA-binding MurR/RpiR family transcriptional regulator